MEQDNKTNTVVAVDKEAVLQDKKKELADLNAKIKEIQALFPELEEEEVNKELYKKVLATRYEMMLLIEKFGTFMNRFLKPDGIPRTANDLRSSIYAAEAALAAAKASKPFPAELPPDNESEREEIVERIQREMKPLRSTGLECIAVMKIMEASIIN